MQVSIFNHVQGFFQNIFIICLYLMVISPGRSLTIAYSATDLPSGDFRGDFVEHSLF